MLSVGTLYISNNTVNLVCIQMLIKSCIKYLQLQ